MSDVDADGEQECEWPLTVPEGVGCFSCCCKSTPSVEPAGTVADGRILALNAAAEAVSFSHLHAHSFKVWG